MRFLTWLTLSLALACLTFAGAAAQDKPREQIKNISDYIVYYGTGRVDDLARFDLAIVQPETLTAEELAARKAAGKLTVAYLSIGEAEPGRVWYTDGRVDPRWLLGRNDNWGSYYVDASQDGWQKLMVELTGEFIAKGFDGVFLDTVDTIDAFPQTTDGMIQLIGGLRGAYPDALLVQNRGFTIIDQVVGDIDALMFEDLSTSYDFDKQEYIYADASYTAEELVALHEKTGLPILALDYAPPDNPAMAYRAVQTAQQYGFIPAVSVINLDDIPDYGIDTGGPEDVRVRSIDVQSDGTNTIIVVLVENIGLTPAERVSISLSVDGDEISTNTYENLGIGEQVEWRVPWASAAETASIRVTAFSLKDRKAGNNTNTLSYKAEAVAVEPLLPPDQQRRRPPENGPDLTATALTSLPTIDGDLADWEGMPCTEVNQQDQISFGDPAGWTGPDDLSGSVCYAWDSENLYVAMTITDDVIVQKYTGTNIWRGDHIELWFDTQLQLDFDSDSANQDDFQLGFSPGDFDTVPPDIFIWTPPTLVDSYKTVQYAVKRTPTGYTAELQIPALVLTGLRLAPDHAIGATFDPSDTDTPGSSEQELMLSTAPKTQWGVPTLWNNLIFQGEPTVTAASAAPSEDSTPVVNRDLIPINDLKASNVPSDVSAIIGYSFDPGDVSQPISDAALETAREIVRRAAKEGALWLDADTGITNFADNFLNDPAISYYPLVQAIVEEAHKAGIKVFFYFSGSEIETPHYPQRPDTSIDKVYPDWMQIDQFGNPMAFLPGEFQAFWLEEDTADAWSNPLASGFREAIMTRAEAVAGLGADGIFVDVPYYFNFDNRVADFSDYSATAFKEVTGFDLPRNLEADGKAYYVWLDWRHQVWRDYFAEMRDRVQKVNPQTVVIAEEWPGDSTDGFTSTGFDTMVADSAIDIAAHEYGYKQEEGGAAVYNRDDWQHTRDVYKWYQGMNRTNWSLCYATNAADSKALAAITYAHQISFWETKTPTMLDGTTGQEWRESLLAWIADNAEVYNGAQPIAEVALVYSNRTRNLTYGSNIETLASVQHLLDASNIPYVVISELNIDRIHDFPYVIFPDVTYATPEVQAAVASYTGHLLLIGPSLTRDEWDENDLTPPVASVTAEQAIASITTTPIKGEGAEGLFVELFRKGDQFQVRIFNPNLDANFEAEPHTVKLTFQWSGEMPAVSALEFLGTPETLTPTQDGDTVQVEVQTGLFTTITIN